MKEKESIKISQYMIFNCKSLEKFCDSFLLNFFENKKVVKFKKIDNKIFLKKVEKVYLVVSKLLNFYINLNFQKQVILGNFLKIKKNKVPYIIGITGSVSVGKSTTANVLRFLLSQWFEHSKVDLISTDCFLYPNRILNRRNIMHKKGFPQSYDIVRLIKFISAIKSGVERVFAPIYSHFNYDIILGKKQMFKKPDVLILEGLNILQNNMNYSSYQNQIISDFIDFSIYIDAKEKLLQKWYINRFLSFSKKKFFNSKEYFYRYSKLKKEEIVQKAKIVWKKVNKINLVENIIPTKKRANLIITKGSNHLVKNIKLRK